MGAAGSAAHATPWETIFVAESAKPSTASDVDDPLTEVIRLRKILYDGQKAVEAMQQEIDSRRSDGKVKLIYQQYQELFPITNGCISVFEVDDTYCLSDAMPGCQLMLVDIPLQEMHERDVKGLPIAFVSKTMGDDERESFVGMFTYDDVPKEYTVVVYEDPEQYAKDMASLKATIASNQVTIGPSNVIRVEGCSCVEGNPCTEANKHNCKDWGNRLAIAKANGWKGF